MKKKLLLPVAAAAEVIALVGVLVAYLALIAAALRDVARTLRLVTVGVRAIEKQLEPLGPVVEDTTANLDRAAALLKESAERRTTAG